MDKEKEIIRELNIVFEKLGWKLLPENNEYPNLLNGWVIFCNFLHIDRTYIPYEKYLNKFTIQQLDNYVVEFIKDIYLKYELKEIVFSGRKNKNNLINLK